MTAATHSVPGRGLHVAHVKSGYERIGWIGEGVFAMTMFGDASLPRRRRPPPGEVS